MALDPQNVPLSLSSGVDTKTDPKQVVPGKLTVLQNASFQSPKQIIKRSGFAPITQNILSGGTISSGAGISSFQDELIPLDGSNLYSYSPSLNKNVNRGTLVPVDLSISPILRNSNTQSQPDSAYHAASGLQCFTYYDSGSAGINYTLIDKSSGTVIVNNGAVIGQVLGATSPIQKVLTLGNYFVILYQNQSSFNLAYKVINTATPTVLSSETVVTNLEIAQCFDATVINNKIITISTTSTHRVNFNSISSSLVLGTQYQLNPGGLPRQVSIAGDASNNVWGTWYDAFGFIINGVVVNPGLTANILAPTVIESGGIISFATQITKVTGTTLTVFYEAQGTGEIYLRTNTLTITGTVGTPATVMRGVGLASKVMNYSGTYYFLVVKGSDINRSIQQTYFLINASGKIVAKLAPSLSGSFYATGLVPEVTDLSPSFLVPYLKQDSLTSVGGNIFSNTGVMSADFSFSPAHAIPDIELAENLHLASGQMWMYDGANVVEHGFHIYPENLRDIITLSGGALGNSLNFNASGLNQIQYMATYEWTDNRGQIHRSAPSPALTVTLPTSVAISFTANISTGSSFLTGVSSTAGLFVGQVLTDTTHAGYLYANTYITAINSGASTITLSQPAAGNGAGDTFTTKDTTQIDVIIPTLRQTLKSNVSIVLYRTQNNQTIFYRVTSVSSPIANSTTVDSVTYTDTTSDSLIVGNEQLYTTGGEVDNIAPPALSAITTFKNRMIYIAPESPFQFGYSKQVIDGSPVEFSAQQFVQNIDQRVGQITSAGPLDDKLILFGPNVKFYVVGDGPSPSGANNDFSEATKITGTTGCSNQASILELPVGLMYQDSSKGIWLLDRSLQEKYIGADVEAFNSATVTSAKLIPGTNQAILTLNSGTQLVYDYYMDQWETDPYASYAFDATVFQNKFTYIQADGLVQQQTPGVYLDNTSLIPLRLKTGWLSFAGIQGFQRAWELQILGTYKSPHTLTVNIYSDFSSVPSQTVTIPVLSDPGLYQYRITIKNQTCETMQVEIIESQSAPYGEGFSLSALSFRVGIKKGLNKLPAGASY